MDTNINGVFLMTRAFAPLMIQRGSGSIINVTVNETTMTRKGFSPYGPSKAAVEAMTTVWAAELEWYRRGDQPAPARRRHQHRDDHLERATGERHAA